jgi:hypothetical protein
VVEDTEDRISWFRQRLPKAVFAKTAEAAFRALDQQPFKVVFLDHDLHWMPADNSIFKGTGKEVARFLAAREYQGIVIIHSRHEEGAEAMKSTFRRLGSHHLGVLTLLRRSTCEPRRLLNLEIDRLIGVSAFKSRISRAIGIPLTKSGRRRKLGAFIFRLFGFK